MNFATNYMNSLLLKLQILCMLVLLCPLVSPAQNSIQKINILFYNVENLFDVTDDPNIEDEEFLPESDRHWTGKRFEDKINKIAKAIIASCEFEMPDIIGLCEVENRYVLEELTEQTTLSNFNYSIIHKDSPDKRGIDVALIYRKAKLEPVRYNYVPLHYPNGEINKTREILHATFETQSGDTIHVFFNHWPSRYGGQAETEQYRIMAAQTLRNEVDLINNTEHHAKVIIMGDFNDQPQNKSLNNILDARFENSEKQSGELINLSAKWLPNGTLKYQQSWQIFDQIIVSDYLLDKSSKTYTSESNAQIVNLPFLLVDDETYKGKKLFRTYLGYRYEGGFSDHLPVRLEINVNVDY